jgi:hypothetical protein
MGTGARAEADFDLTLTELGTNASRPSIAVRR